MTLDTGLVVIVRDNEGREQGREHISGYDFGISWLLPPASNPSQQELRQSSAAIRRANPRPAAAWCGTLYSGTDVRLESRWKRSGAYMIRRLRRPAREPCAQLGMFHLCLSEEEGESASAWLG